MAFTKGKSGNPHGRKKGAQIARTRMKAAVIESAELKVSESELVSWIRTAAAKDWKAAAWILERRFPERWARPERIEGTLSHNVHSIDNATAGKIVRDTVAHVLAGIR